MHGYLSRRLIQVIPLLLGISLVSFVIVMSAPGDPIATMFPPEQLATIDREVLREKLGLNQPLYVQYGKMMWSFINGDLKSFQEKRSAITMIRERLPTTLTFAFLAMAVSLAIGIPVALLSATRPNSVLDDIAMVGSLLGLSLPNFWLALILILILAERLHFLPATGMRPLGLPTHGLLQMLPYLVMPTTVLSLGMMPAVVRYARSSMIEVMIQDYIRVARSKGLSERMVIYRHALKNALIPVVSIIAAVFPYLIGGSVVVESVFALPGLGRLAVRAALNRDYPVVLTINMLMAFIVIISSLVADVCYSYLDPRIRQG